MPCGWVLIWLVLSHCPKAGCCHGLNNLHALGLSVPMALLSSCPKAGCCHHLDSPDAIRLGVFLRKDLQECKNIGTVGSVCGAEGNAAVDFSYLGKGSTEFFELLRIRHDFVAISAGCPIALRLGAAMA